MSSQMAHFTKSFHQFSLLRSSVMILFCCLLLTFTCLQFTDATHFQYGLFKWSRSKDNSTMTVEIEQAWRWWKFAKWGQVHDPATNTDVLYKWNTIYLNPNFIRTVDKISWTSYASGTLPTQTKTTSNALKVISGDIDATNGSTDGPGGEKEAWWFGVNTIQLPPTIFTGINRAYSAQFTLCCRISTLEDKNNDKDSKHGGWFNPRQREYSIAATGYPREYVYYNVPLSDNYESVRAIDRDDPFRSLKYSLTSTSSSSLVQAAPQGLLSVNNVGIVNWTPTADPNVKKKCRAILGYCVYAVSFTIESLGSIDRSAVELDFTFVSIRQCLPGVQNPPCNHPPAFDQKSSTITAISSVPSIYNFVVSDEDNEEIRLQQPVLSEGLSLTQSFANTAKSKINARVVYDIEIDGPRGAIVCFQASDIRNVPSVGSFCLTFVVIKPDYMFLIGTRRAFTPAQADAFCLKSVTCPWGSGSIDSTLGATRKPTLSTQTGSITSSNFNDWWANGSAKLTTLTMVRYFNNAIDGSVTPPAVIDPIYKDPTKRVYTYRRPFATSAMDSSTYFTYSMTTQFDLLRSQSDTARAMKFGVSGGELWVFINNVLVVSITNQQNTITYETNDQLINTPPTRTLTVGDLQTTFPDLFSKSDTQFESLNLDIFYTHRNLPYSGFHMEFGSSTKCSAISILRSGQYKNLVDNAVIFDHPKQGSQGSAWNPSNWSYSSSFTSFTAAPGSLRLISSQSTSTAANVWYSESMLKVLNGFEAVFDFTMTGNGSGFAFVIQSQSPTAKGSEGAGLGYHGINKAIAIEFDVLTDSTFDTSVYTKQHISGHVSPDTAPYPISAREDSSSWPEGSTPAIFDNLPFTFNNGTKHNVRIEFSPTPFSYFLYVYVGINNQFNQRPLYTAQFPRNKLKQFFQDGAFVGFTTSNLALNDTFAAGTVDINKFKLTIVPPLAETSGPISLPTSGIVTAIAGETLGVTIQLRDACGSDVIATGESLRFISRFAHVSSKIPFDETQNAVYDIITPSVTDLGEGQYLFSGIPTRAGMYRLHFYYQEVGQGIGQGQPISNSPVIYGPNDTPSFSENTAIPASIIAASPNSQTSFYTYSSLPKSIDNVSTGAPYFPLTATTLGVVCSIITSDGEIKLDTVAQVFTTLASYNDARTAIDPSEYFACVSNAKSTAGVLDIIRSINTPSAPIGNPETSAAWIATQSATQIAFQINPLASVALSWISSNIDKQIRIDLESASPARISSTATRGTAMILPSRYNMIYPINSQGEFYLYLKDVYGNPIYSGSSVTVEYTPNQIAEIESEAVPNSPFTRSIFETQISNLYAVSVFLGDDTSSIRTQIGKDGQLVVDAGAASYLRSQHQGLTIGGIVDVEMSFRINLYDIVDNRVLSQTATKVEVTAIYIVPSGVTDIAQALESWTDKQNILTFWDNINQQYIFHYTPTWSGVFNAIVIINGETVVDLSKEMINSKGASIVIVAGPCAQNSLISEIFSGQIESHLPDGPYTAGEVIIFNIQTKDKYGNDRYVPIQSNGVLRVRAFQDSSPLSQTNFSQLLDTNLSSLVSSQVPSTGEGYITASYIGSGQYQFSLTWKKVATDVALEVRLIISASSTETVISRELQPAIIGQIQPVKTTALWTFAINPGVVSVKSIFILWCDTAPCAAAAAQSTTIASTTSNVQFVILPQDMYGNQITPNGANLAAIQAAFNIKYESSSPVYNFATSFTIDSISGPFYHGSIQTSVAGIYIVDPQFAETGQQISLTYQSVTHSTFLVTADVTNMLKVTPTVQWPEQLYQTLPNSGQFQALDFTDLDQFANFRLTPTDETKFALYTRTDTSVHCSQDHSLMSTQPCEIVSSLGRPMYSCPVAIHEVSPTRIMILSTMNADGTMPLCGLDSNDCPNSACSTSKVIQLVESEETDAYVFASATLTGNTYNVIKNDLTDTLLTDIDVGTFKAGSNVVIFVRDSTGLQHSSTNLRELRLTPFGTASKFISLRATSEACLVDKFGPQICSLGRIGQRIWAFKVNYQTVLAAIDTKFAVYFSTISTAMNAFSYSLVVQPGPFSPQKSTLNFSPGAASFVTTAGVDWFHQFKPIDLYGNSIPSSELFSGFASLQTRIYNDAQTQLTGPGITCIYVDSIVSCKIPGIYFTKSGLQGFYLAMGVDFVPPPTTNPVSTSLVSGKISTLDVAHGISDLMKSKLHIIPSGVGNLATYNLPPITGTEFEIYFFAFDTYNNAVLAPSETDPLKSTTSKLSIKLKFGDIFFASPTIIVGSTWIASSFLTRLNPAYVTTVIIDKPTRIGFSIVATAGNIESAPLTIFVRSNVPAELMGTASPPDSEGSGLYSYTNSIVGDKTLTNNDLKLTIDSVFSYIVKVVDDSSVPYLYAISSPIMDDSPQVIIDFTTTRKVVNTQGVSVDTFVSLPATITPITRTANGVKYAIPGQFVLTSPASALSTIGMYDLRILINAADGSVKVAQYQFLLSPGLPVMDNTEILQVDSFQTGTPGYIKFYLRDRLFNRINKNFMIDQQNYLATSSGTFSPITSASRGQVVSTIHTGVPSCSDVHEQNDISNLSYAIPRLNAQSFPNFSMKIQTSGDQDVNDILYTIQIVPVPRGLYTFNMTLISSLDEKIPALSGSYFGCANLIPLSFTVSSGSPIASLSYYTVEPVVGNWVAERYVGSAGTKYKVIVLLLDRDGSQTTPSSDDQIAVFYTPDGATGTTITSTNGLYFNPADSMNSNLDGPVVVENLSLIYGHSYLVFSFIPKRAAASSQFAIYLKEKSINGNDVTYLWKRISGTVPQSLAADAHPSTQTFRVNHGAPASVIVTTQPTNTLIAGQTVQFQTTALDKYGNPITTNELSTISVIVSRDSSTFTDPIVDITGLRWTVPASNIVTSNTGVSTIQFVPAWEGQYSIQIILNSPNGATYYASTSIPQLDGTPLQVLHATCAGQSLTSTATPPLNYMCASTGLCVAEYSACSSLFDTLICPAGSVVYEGACVELLSIGWPKCSDGSYVYESAYCPPAVSCPPGTIQCAANKGQCRAAQEDCPAPPVCPPGLMVCPNQLSCAATFTNCPITPEATHAACTATFGPRAQVCASGQCVQSPSDCPTPPSCSLGEVLCLTDGRCVSDASHCYTLPSYHVQTPTTCLTQYPISGVLCPDSTCASKFANCPSRITCPVGKVLCARNNTCQSSLTLCPAAPTEPLPILPDNNTIDCSAAEFRCPISGTCVQNLLLCPTQVTCPADQPVLCADRSCKSSLAQCTRSPICDREFIQCPTTGQCVTSASQCPVSTTCPTGLPILCPSGACAANIDKCAVVPDCPNALPYRCSTGVCRSSLNDCSSAVSCPVTAPMVCSDGSCAISPDMCVQSSTGSGSTPASTTCTGSTPIRCPNGACSANTLTCPSVITCPLGSQRCSDGSCRASCDAVQVVTCASQFLLACPSSGAGTACARSLEECPQGSTCPINAPVKCIDATCAIALTECPPLPSTNPPANKYACADGSWAELGSCPTPMTCAAETLVKCSDQSCKSTIVECPALAACDFASTTPYRCPSGSCVANPWDCSAADPSQCPTSSPIRCQGKGGVACFASLSSCISSTAQVDPTAPQDGNVIYSNPCPGGQIYCRDGSCADSAAFCPAKTCPSTFPVLCIDGSCAKSKLSCPDANGCPRGQLRCPGVGKCVDRIYECPAEQCTIQGLIACPDGTCKGSSSLCKSASGCSSTQTRCSDSSCVDDASLCSSQANYQYANSCPPGSPFRCGNGLCVVTSFQCVSAPAGICTNPKTPVLCASGECRQSTELCPLVKPCTEGTQRCGDGSCRIASDALACPIYDPCTEFGENRCKQSNFQTTPILDGTCSIGGQCYGLNGCPIGSDNKVQYRCPQNGRCVDDSVKTTLCTFGQRLLNGCNADKPVKCWNGECAISTADCPATNNCPAVSPYRCPNGECVLSSWKCSMEETTCPDTKIHCADGSCKDTMSDCSTSFGCPISTPVRCQDGSCKTYPATMRTPRSGLTNEEINTLTCPPTVSCPSNYYLCEDLSCVLSQKSCPSVAWNCPEGNIRCADNTCRPSFDKCGYNFKVNENGQPIDINDAVILDPTDTTRYVWEPSSSAPIKCPVSSPLICQNGACVSDILQCDRNTDPATTTLTGSPDSPKADASKPYQVLCFDGSYRENYAACRTASILLNDEQIATDPTAPKCVDFCADGTCVRASDKFSARDVCPVVASCTAGLYRCGDGTCRTSCDGIAAVTCSSNLVPDIDGQCREYGKTLQFYGCFGSVRESFQCPSRECAPDLAGCIEAANRPADNYARGLLRDSQWATRRSAYKSTYNVGTTSLIHAIPNSVIAEFFQITGASKEAKATGTPDASIDTRSCRQNCVADQQLYRTSIVYSPLLSSQTYSVGPLATGFTVQLYSGLEVDTQRDLGIYIEQVGQNVYYNASNRVTYSRVGDFRETMTSAQTVLSPIFSCSVGDGITEPFDIGIQLTSLIDRSKTPSPAPTDICLARLRRYPEYNYAVWECLFNETQRLSGELQYGIRQSTAQPLRQAISYINQCSDENFSEPSTTGAFDLLQTDQTSPPAVYAFIHSPVATAQVYKQSEDNWFKNNIIWLLFVIIGGVLIVFLFVFAISRLSRYSKKTDKMKDEIQNTQREIDDMEQYGEKRRDNEILYCANPLAISFDQQQALADQTNEAQLEKKRQIFQAQQLDSQERKQIIDSLEKDVETQLAILESLRKKAGSRVTP